MMYVMCFAGGFLLRHYGFSILCAVLRRLWPSFGGGGN
jgi:hypothetical protein